MKISWVACIKMAIYTLPNHNIGSFTSNEDVKYCRPNIRGHICNMYVDFVYYLKSDKIMLANMAYSLKTKH